MCAGVPFEPWNHQGPAHEWLAKIARPPAPKFEAAIPEDEQVNLPLPPTVGSDRNGPPQVGTEPQTPSTLCTTAHSTTTKPG